MLLLAVLLLMRLPLRLILRPVLVRRRRSAPVLLLRVLKISVGRVVPLLLRVLRELRLSEGGRRSVRAVGEGGGRVVPVEGGLTVLRVSGGVVLLLLVLLLLGRLTAGERVEARRRLVDVRLGGSAMRRTRSASSGRLKRHVAEGERLARLLILLLRVLRLRLNRRSLILRVDARPLPARDPHRF
jgi:hypothetical protein